MRLLRAKGAGPVAAVETLTRRLGQSSPEPEEDAKVTLDIVAAQTPCFRGSPGPSPHAALKAAQAPQLSASPAPPVAAPVAAPVATGAAVATPRSRGEGSKGGGAALKRSRSLESGAKTSNPKPALSEHEAEKEKTLMRQVAGLGAEINDAMRAGDRSKVALLMRQRDRLRATMSEQTKTQASGGDAKGQTADAAPGEGNKRARS